MLVLLACVLRASAKETDAPDAGYLDKSIQAMGGYLRYERLETIAYEFLDIRSGDPDPITIRGKHFFKFHDSQGFRAREELTTASGESLTVVTSSQAWSRENGRPLEDAGRLSALQGGLRQAFFWLLLPHNIREATLATQYEGLGYFRGELTRKLGAKVPPELSPQFTSFTLHLDTGSFTVDGVSSVDSTGEGSWMVSFTSHIQTPSLLLPGRRVTFDPEGTLQSDFQIFNLRLNAYMDESLFRPAESRDSTSPSSPPVRPKKETSR